MSLLVSPSTQDVVGDFEVVAIGASLGGLQTLSQLLTALPKDFPASIVVVQHLNRNSPSQFAEVLDRRVPMKVKWAEHRERLEPSTVYFAPPNHHVQLNSVGHLLLSQTPPVEYARPSVTQMFQSVAASYQERAIGVILTGMGKDGALGIQAIKHNGGRVLVQSPQTCQAPFMPQAAIATNCVDFILPVDKIASALITLVMVKGASTFFKVAPHYSAPRYLAS